MMPVRHLLLLAAALVLPTQALALEQIALGTPPERIIALERGSNFRDLGGYVGAGGKKVRTGRIFRSGAMPLLTENDYKTLGALNITTIVDLRSLDERMIAPTMLDDRTGATFISNDYSLAPLMKAWAASNGENTYSGMVPLLAPQYRAIFKSLLRHDGAVLYNCAAGQDRTGIGSALILSALGVDRATILRDYHWSTELRRPLNEMPPLDPAAWPGNPIVPYYAAAQKDPAKAKAEPLYTPSGQSHLVQFFAHVDKNYGSVEAMLDKELGITSADITRLRALYLD
jgi:protein-tyrosine phosphatase